MTTIKHKIDGMDGIKGIDEELGGTRCGFLYTVNFKNGGWIFLDLNHRLIIDNNEISFEKKKDFDGNEWDYKKWSMESPIIHYFPNNGHVNEPFEGLLKKLKEIYSQQEKSWRDN